MTAQSRTRLALWAIAFACLSGGIVAGLTVARAKVIRTQRDLLREETKIAVALMRVTGDTGALMSVYADRWSLTAEVDPLLDEAVVDSERGTSVGRATVYDADSWFQTGTLRLSAGQDSSPPIPGRTLLTAIVALALLATITAVWVRAAARSKQITPMMLALTTVGVLSSVSAPLWEARTWAVGRLEQATAQRMAVAERTLELAPDIPALLRIPGAVAQLTGMSFLVLGPAGDVVNTTMPAAVTEELAARPSPFRGRAKADRVEYLVSDVAQVRLAVLPYDHSSPGPTLAVLGLLGILLALLPLSLARIVHRPRTFRHNVVAWSFLAPSLAHLLVFTAGPLAFAAWLSLHRWSLIDVARPFVGIANYVRVLGDTSFWNAVLNTVVFTLHVPASMALALGLALLVHRSARGIVLLRATLFLPTITSLVAIAMVWQWMLHDEYGLINWLLSWVGISPVRWLSSPSTALLSIMIMAVWLVIGYQMVLFQAGLSAIPRDLYDAARIDGAGPWRRFFHVTVPGLRHTLFFVLVTSVIGSFQVFGAVYVMTEGGPLRSTDVVVFHIYREAWEFLRFGDAAAMSWVLFAVIFVVTWLQFRLLEQRVDVRSSP